jgi:hypothetical protein
MIFTVTIIIENLIVLTIKQRDFPVPLAASFAILSYDIRVANECEFPMEYTDT